MSARLSLAAGHTIREEATGGLMFDQRVGRIQRINATAVSVVRNALSGRPPDAGLADRFPSTPPHRLSEDANTFVEELLGRGTLRRSAGAETAGRLIESSWDTAGLCLSAPRSVFWETTSACTIRTCVHCYAADRTYASFERWHQFIDDLGDLGVFTLDIGGGEPLLYADLADAVNRANSRGLRCNLATSLYVQPRRVRQLVEAVGDWGLNSLQVSLDGSGPAVHNAIRGRADAFQVMAGNLSVLAGAGVSWSFSSTVMATNLHDVSSIVETAHALGGRSLRFVRIIPSGRGQRADLLLSRDDYQRLCLLLADLAERNRDRIRISVDDSFAFLEVPDDQRRHLRPRLDWLSPPFVGCGAGRSLLAVGPDGSVWPCAYLSSPAFLVGSVHQTPLSQLWRDSPGLRRMRAQTSLGPVCDACDLKALCQGGCRAAAYGVEGTTESRDPGCWLACA